MEDILSISFAHEDQGGMFECMANNIPNMTDVWPITITVLCTL